MTTTLKMHFDLEKVTIKEGTLIEEMGVLDDQGKPVNKDARFGKMVEIFDRACTVEGFESIEDLPLPVIFDIMRAFNDEMQSAAKEANPTASSEQT